MPSEKKMESHTLSGNTKIKMTKEALLNAFYRLASTHDLADITVSSLCREAKINRTTFYKYYSIPSDVLVEKAKDIASYSSEFLTHGNFSLYESMLGFCNIFYENRKFIFLYFHACGDLMPIIYRGIASAATDVDFMRNPENNFIAGGVGGIAMYWLQHDFKESPEEIACLLTEYVKKVTAEIS